MTEPERQPDLIADLAFDPRTGLVDLDTRLQTLKDEADARAYRFDRHGVRNELQAATFRLREPRHVRLLLSPTGALAIEITPVG